MKSERNILSRILGSLKSAAVVAISLLTLASCADEVSMVPENADPKAGYITLDLFSTKTRADEEATDPDNTLNEDLIRNARIYFFPEEAAQDTDKPIYSLTRTINENESATVSVKLTNELVEQLFPGNLTTAQVYVLCNIEATKVIPSDATLGDLKRLEVTTSFENAITPQNPTSMFVMNGQNSVSLVRDVDNPSKSTVTGEVRLKRAASRISLDVKLQESAEDSYGNIWEPVPGSMYALITNGVKTSAVTPSLYTPKPEDYYTTTTSDFGHRFGTPVAEAEYPYQLQMPFYTYPNSWADDNEKMTYLTIMLPWRQVGGTVVRNCWYMVPVVKNETAITRNVSYHVKIDIGVLGSYEPEEPLEMQASYEAVQWGDAPVNVDIKDYRYLVVDQETYTINNESLANISFYSSHEVEVTDVKMTYYLYNTNAAGVKKEVSVSMAQNNASAPYNGGKGLYTYQVDNSINALTGTRTLEFDHPLLQWTPYSSNNIVVPTGPNANGTYPTNLESNIDSAIAYYRPTDNAAYSTYKFEITIAHKDNPAFTETIEITQYPAMYIETEQNPGATYSVRTYQGTDGGFDNRTANFGYAFVNAERYDSGNTYWRCISYGSLLPFDYATNNGNPNMYIITISQLDATDDNYIIGDPRLSTIDNLNDGEASPDAEASWGDANNTSCNDAADMSGVTRKLLYYHPTDESDNTKMMVAPKLRIASSFGEMTYPTNPLSCKRRCATYQERAYPAGRWRVPTYGEMKYIVKLALDGKIPKLFNTSPNASEGARYLTAHGVYSVDESSGELRPYTGTSTSAYVRPVYDEWYWQDKLDFDSSAAVGLQFVYTLGDEE